MQIIDAPVTTTENEFIPDVKELLAAGEGKAAAYTVDESDADKRTAKVNSLKLKFQRAANTIDRTARSTVTIDGDTATIVFKLRPKQVAKTGDKADAKADLNAEHAKIGDSDSITLTDATPTPAKIAAKPGK